LHNQLKNASLTETFISWCGWRDSGSCPCPWHGQEGYNFRLFI